MREIILNKKNNFIKKYTFFHFCFQNFSTNLYNLLIFGIVPLSIMSTCCILIIRSVGSTREKVYDIGQNSNPSVIPKNDHVRSITRTLLWIDLLFPITIFPALFLQLYIKYHRPKDCLAIGIMNLTFSVLFAMIYIKNTFCFFIFYLTGQKFRRAFMRLIRCKHINMLTASS